ncbi:MAG: pteridine-dependent deoxygenase [Rhodanobacteraceae bacterium]|nr:pteridine-dependent deoxygenase [Rhodanobacteraceae bacterium]
MAQSAAVDEPSLVCLLPGRPNVKYPDGVVLPLRDLVGGSRIEFWNVAESPRIERHLHFTLRYSDDWLFGSLELDEHGDLATATEHAYGLVLAHGHRLGFPHLVRLWNYFGAINAGEGDDERYRRFVAGRARVIDHPPDGGYAAATAIGLPSPPDQLHVHWLATKQPGIAIENPRQVSAFAYPRDYGPVAPGFSRAMLLPGDTPLLLISGTASIVGHASQHPDTLAQLDEILMNLDALIVAAGARACARRSRPRRTAPGLPARPRRSRQRTRASTARTRCKHVLHVAARRRLPRRPTH